MTAKTKKTGRKFSFTKLIPKSKKFQILAVASIFGIIGAYFIAFSSAATATVPIYRLNSPHLPNYFYTTSRAEYDGLPTYGYAKEGTAFNAWTDGADGRVPVYQVGVNNKHLFTSSVGERDSLVRGGWYTDRVAFYAYSSPAAGRAPVYRLYNSKTGTHLLTTSEAEKHSASTSHGYTYEGIAFYVANEKPIVNDHRPEGVVDRNDCSIVGGWSLDQDNKSVSTEVHLYIDGTGYNLGKTSGSRPDVNSAKGATGNHGFTWVVPAKYRDGKIHTVDVFAINVNSGGKLDGDNTRIGSKAWACDAAAREIEVGTCVTRTFVTSSCTKDQSQVSDQVYVSPNEIASCVAIDGRTMIRCSQDAHDKQVAEGLLIEQGCIGKTLDGSNRVDCSNASRAELDAFFKGLETQKTATVNRARVVNTPNSSSGATPSAPGMPPIDFNAIAAIGAANLYYSPYTPTVADCTVWYQKKVYDVRFLITVGSHMEWRNYGTIRVTKDQCRKEFNKPNRARSHYQWNGSNFTN